MNKRYTLPNNLIILISGVPGVGKTTISYELLKSYNELRLVEETDIIREILRGYNCHLTNVYNIQPEDVYPHDIFLSYNMARQQCKIMKNSIANIVKRQQRKEIPSYHIRADLSPDYNKKHEITALFSAIIFNETKHFVLHIFLAGFTEMHVYPIGCGTDPKANFVNSRFGFYGF